ncbi:hypothetical protein BU26DRAFT_276189 [Trematosphaeria pertusa]|uniref:Uncharacterized protein n=1 Tax=Trematosphaeria pertusa TaxID=390896 RepID=A0A6A6IKF5_9PLEO|nr:uncharacterized protein BU26DRAFT_276189 [Trematosphaeria pertusa]KAF2251095.1 hypothetical protein BU26DRAFT_276189 [Trematosphaeria pertusa]
MGSVKLPTLARRQYPMGVRFNPLYSLGWGMPRMSRISLYDFVDASDTPAVRASVSFFGNPNQMKGATATPIPPSAQSSPYFIASKSRFFATQTNDACLLQVFANTVLINAERYPCHRASTWVLPNNRSRFRLHCFLPGVSLCQQLYCNRT